MNPRNIEDIYALSPLQEGILFHVLYEPEEEVYVSQLTCTLVGPLDPPAFEIAWRGVVGRHPALRTAFAWKSTNKSFQVVGREVALPLTKKDWSDLSQAERQARWEAYLASDRKSGFDPSRAPLMRLTLIREADDRHRFLWTHHHLLLDGWSLSKVLAEVFLLYEAQRRGETLELPPSPPFRAYIAWLAQQSSERAEAYWRAELAGFTSPTPLPGDERSLAPGGGHGEQIRTLPQEDAEALRNWARSHQLTLNTLVQGAWALLLARCSGRQDVLFGVTVSGRPPSLAGVESMVGLFINTLPCRVEVQPTQPSLPWLRDLQDRQLELRQYEYSRLAQVQTWSDLERGMPLFESLVAFENYPLDRSLPRRNGEFRAEEVQSIDMDNLPLALVTDPGLSLRVTYDRRRFEDTAVQRLIGHLGVLLQGLTRSPDQRLEEVPLLTAAERHQLLAEWNHTGAPQPRKQALLELFADQVERAGDRIAAECEGIQVTYRALDGQADLIASRLRQQGVRSADRVGVFGRRGDGMLATLLGILKAGAAFVPLDPRHPDARLLQILETGRLRLLATQTDLESRALQLARSIDVPPAVLCWDSSPAAEGWSAGSLPVTADPCQLACIFYTSGSTGAPKGVMVERAGMDNHIQAKVDLLALNEESVVVQNASHCFDISVWQFLAPLAQGGRVVIYPDETAIDPLALLRAISRDGVTVLETLPSLLEPMLQAADDLAVGGERVELPSLTHLISNAETLPVPLSRRWFDHFAGIPLINTYGATECSDDTTHQVLRTLPPEALRVGVGRPIAGLRMYVLDPQLDPVPMGCTSQIAIGGIGVGRGYVADPARTAAVFVPDPFARRPGERLYLTGDLGRWQMDGTLEFVGRRDLQVKVRGHRVELGEIEAALALCPGVREAVVVIRVAGSGEGQLVAYLVPASPLDALAVRKFLLERLPEHMVPTAFVQLDRLPLTPNGKIDRGALPAPPAASARPGTWRPRTQVEEMLAYIWAEVLGVEEVGSTSNFFELGGHSLIATRLVSRMRAAFNAEIPIRAVFERPTLAELAEAVELAIQGGSIEQAPPLVPVPRDRPLPLSFSQQRLWFLDQLEPASSLYNIPVAVRVRGELSVGALKGALHEIVRRHEVLRTVFQAIDGQPFQVVLPPFAPALPVVDLSGLERYERERVALQLAIQEARNPFDLANGPVLRAVLLRLAEREHAMCFSLHHIAGDGWSMGVLTGELAILYEAICQGRASSLPELPIQYADYAQWQRDWLRGSVLEEHLAVWRRRLQGAPAALDLPTDRLRPAVPQHRGTRRYLALSEGLTTGLRALCRREKASMFMTLLAALQALLGRWSGKHDVSVGVPIAGRNRLEIESLIGFFVNTLVMRAELPVEAGFLQLLKQVRETALEAHAHQDLPFEKLVEELQPERDLGRSPLFQVMLAFQNAPAWDGGLYELDTDLIELGGGTVKFDLLLTMSDLGDQVAGVLDYDVDLFDGPSMIRLLAHFETLLAGVVGEPASRILDLPLLSAAERAQLACEWNATQAPLAIDRCLHALIEDQVARTPEAVAVVCEGGCLTYGSLDLQASRLARCLRRHGVGPDVVVGVAMERSLELVIALCAILKAGGAYLPLDPSYPDDRLRLMLEDSQARLVIAQPGLSLHPPENVQAVYLDRKLLASAPASATEPSPAMDPGLAAYVIYTSGSTGRPKGVINCHRALCNRLLWMQDVYNLTAADRVLQKTPFGFDVSVWELFWPLITGACLVMARPEGHRDSDYLVDLIADEEITTLHFVPSMLAVFLLNERLAACRALQRVIASGEALSPGLQERFFGRFDGVELHNLYGPTEAAIDVTSWACRPDDRRATVPIGQPIANTEIYLADRSLHLAPVGLAGELYIGGVGLARGYLGRPDLTAERFLPDPFGERPGARLYRTGDIARRLSGGEIEYLGRADFQLKIRGFRIELGEIEAALDNHPAIRESVVVVRETPSGDRQLVAYVVPAPAVTEIAAADLKEVRSHLQKRLPEYMVPATITVLAALPLNPNGKLDRNALPLPEPVEGAGEGHDDRGHTPVEELLAGIWTQVLGRERIRRDDNFFELGGHSLLATQLVSRVRAVFGVELQLRAVFERPTMRGLAAAIEERMHAGESVQVPPLVPLERDGLLPLSFAQQRLWFIEQLEPGNVAYNLPVGLRLHGELSLAALEAALGEIARRHEALRTRFQTVDGKPWQVVMPPGEARIPLIDLSSLSAARREAEIAHRAATEARSPFDLAWGPLFRALVLRSSLSDHVALFTMHHIVSDGWSMGVLVQEVGELYRAFLQGTGASLPPLPLQYADYAVWQRQWLSGDVLAEHVAYWRDRLAGIPTVIDLPLDRARPAKPSLQGGRIPVVLSADRVDGLTSLCRARTATLFMVLLAAFQTLLSRLTLQDDIVVGSPVANRGRLEVERLIGFFVNLLALRARVTNDPAFARLLADVREGTLAAYAHQGLPFDKLVEELQPERSASHAPLFQVQLALQNLSIGRLDLPGLRLEPVEVDRRSTNFDLTLALAEGPRDLAGAWEYSTDILDATTVMRIAHCFEVVLDAIVARPEARVSELPLLSAAERHQLTFAWHDTAGVDLREAPCLHQIFAGNAARRPDSIAMTFGDLSLSYGEVDRLANRLARYLVGFGVGPGALAGVFMERSPEAVIALLGILKSGGGFLPIDPSYPMQRVALMLEDSGISVVLTQSALAEELPRFRGVTVALDPMLEIVGGESDAPVPCAPGASDLAYVIYTSGSTGRPKGVMVPHGGLANLSAATVELFGIGAEDRVLQFASLSFDASVWEIAMALWAGAKLVLAPRLALLPGPDLLDVLRTSRVTALLLPPSALWVLPAEEADQLRDLRVLLVGGEAFPLELARRWWPGRRLFNAYGPTEASVCVTVWRYGGESRLPIGRPIANVEPCVLDRQGGLCPLGSPGELCLGGVGLARGYLGRPELTAERFVPDPLSDRPGQRLYRTGDLVRWLADGTLEFLGRLDQQVKVRGFRIELGEIEAALAECPGTHEVAVAVTGEPSATLTAYVVSGEGAGLTDAELRTRLRARLPDYMVPSRIVFLDRLPLTPNGKIDRKALAQGDLTERGAEEGLAAPRTQVEELLTGVFGEVLRVDRVGMGDNFFDLGGHSLIATQLVSRVRESLGVDLPLNHVFASPTVMALAEKIEELRRQRMTVQPPELAPVSRQRKLPLSFAQQRLWTLDQLEPLGPTYNTNLSLTVQGNLQVGALMKALKEVLRRHEVLRTSFLADAGEPFQVIAEGLSFELPVVDLKTLGEDDRKLEVERLSLDEARRPFVLAQAPLLRCTLVLLGTEEQVLLLTMHHIISDGWSLGILVREVSSLYESFSAGEPSRLPELPIQYADFAHWQRSWLTGEVLEKYLSFWRCNLQGAPDMLRLPVDRARPEVRGHRGERQYFQISQELSAVLRDLCRQEGVTLFMALFAVLNTLLYRYSGQTDIVVGTPVANRPLVKTEGLIGFFINTLPLRTRLLGTTRFRELLKQVRQQVLEAFDHQDLPLEKVIEEIRPGRHLSHTPLYQVVFGMQNAPLPVLDRPEAGLTIFTGEVDNRTAKFDLTITVWENDFGLMQAIEYDSDLFEPSTIARMGRHFERLLAQAVADPSAPLDTLQMFSQEEEVLFRQDVAVDELEAEFLF